MSKSQNNVLNNDGIQKKDALISGSVLSNSSIVQELIDNHLIEDCVYFQFLKLTMNGSQTDRNKLQFKEDLFQDIIEFLLKYDNAKLNNAYQNKHLNALITRMIINQLYSNTSRFYNSYLKFDQRSDEIKSWQEPRTEI